MENVSANDITRASIASFENTPDLRLRELTTALTKHLHAFVAEVRPTQQEWETGIEFLTRVGHTCVGPRQEFILLSDVLGVSMLVDAVNDSGRALPTESTVLGPFYVDNPPPADSGADIAAGVENGVPLWIDVRITDEQGAPIAGALIDIWQCDADGLYDVQRDSSPEEHHLRARFTTDADGRLRCWSIVPVAYQIPSDGPVGDLLGATGRHPWRPAHVHFLIDAPGYARLTTHLFPRGGDYLDSDAVFGVKPSLVVDLPRHAGGCAPDGRKMPGSWHSLAYSFILEVAE